MSSRPSLLYVDDEVINLDLFKIIFKTDYEVHTAVSGKQGLEIMEATPGITIVISDMKMPHMNGIEFIRACREQFPATTYFILTGYEVTTEIHKSLESGLISCYFKKPFDAAEIAKALKDASTQTS